MGPVTFERARTGAVATLTVLTLAFLVTLLPGVRPHEGFVVAYDGWLQGSAYVAIAVAAVAAVADRVRMQPFWTMIAAALVLRATGFVLFLAVVRRVQSQPSPSVADVAWILSGITLVAAMCVGIARVAPQLTGIVVLDGLLAALTTAGLTVMLTDSTFQILTSSRAPSGAVAVYLTYPIIDAALVVVVVALAVAVGEQMPGAGRLAIIGLLGFGAVDLGAAFEVARGAYRHGSWLDGLSMVASALLATACWYGVRRTSLRQVGSLRRPNLTTPIVLALVCILAVASDVIENVPASALFLFVGALGVAIVRGVLTLRGDRTEADLRLQAAHDERLKFQALVEASGDFIAIAGLDGVVSYLNPAGRALVGLPPGTDVTKTTIADYLTPDGLERSVSVEQPAVIANGRWEGESTLRNQRGGDPIPVAISSFLMHHPDTGEPLALATVQRDITERLAADRALEDLAVQRQRLLARLVKAEEDERARIAADVHDDSVQALAVVDLRLGLLKKQLGEDVSPEQDLTLTRVHESVSQATSRLRELLFDLESPALDVDLATALTNAASHLFEDTDVHWEVSGDTTVDLPEATRVTAYRIVKEALVNALKHAQASRVEIHLARDAESGGVAVSVTDDGRGFEVGAPRVRPGHLGLDAMADRAAVAGGWLRADSTPGAGTRVTLWLPEAVSELA